MLSAILALAVVVQVAAPEDVSVEATPKVVIAQVVACGVKRGEARIRVDDVLQEAVVDIRRSTALSDAQLTCLAQVSVASGWFLTFDPATDARYEPRYSRASGEAGLGRARAWVASHGLASRVPLYDAAHDDAAATMTRIEALCGAPPGTYRQSVSPTALRSADEPPVSDETLLCISHVAFVAGVRLGFVGNEGAAPQQPR